MKKSDRDTSLETSLESIATMLCALSLVAVFAFFTLLILGYPAWAIASIVFAFSGIVFNYVLKAFAKVSRNLEAIRNELEKANGGQDK